ncbi:Os05g0246450, partial [Oryza sativa Japonica Group]
QCLRSLVVHRRCVRRAGLPAGRDDVAGDERLAGAGREADGERRLQRRAGAQLPDGAPRLLHRRPGGAGPCLHEVHPGEVAVPVLVLDEHREVAGVRAGVHGEGEHHSAPVARHPDTRQDRS